MDPLDSNITVKEEIQEDRDECYQDSVTNTRYEREVKLVLFQIRHEQLTCGICSQIFTSVSSLNDHMKTHIKDEPFVCEDDHSNMEQNMNTDIGIKEEHSMCDYESPHQNDDKDLNPLTGSLEDTGLVMKDENLVVQSQSSLQTDWDNKQQFMKVSEVNDVEIIKKMVGSNSKTRLEKLVSNNIGNGSVLPLSLIHI